MKVAVYGVGAIGGLIAGRLAATDCQVSVVARGNTLMNLHEHGLRLQVLDRIVSIPVRAEQSPEKFGAQDVVIIAVKAPALQDVAAQIAPMIAPDTIVITAMNGVPWWFFEGKGVAYQGSRLASINPTPALSRAIPVQQIIGCVVHLSSSCPAPGLVQAGFGNRLILGEPAGGRTARVDSVVNLLCKAAFDAEASANIRADIWYKLWGNMTMNPVSALTGATVDKILDEPLVHRFCLSAMQEAAAIGAKIGCAITQSGEDRMAITRKLGAFKTSMLQDTEAGKDLEIDALVTVVHEIGKLAGVATPAIDGLLGLIRLFGRTRGIYPAAPPISPYTALANG